MELVVQTYGDVPCKVYVSEFDVVGKMKCVCIVTECSARHFLFLFFVQSDFSTFLARFTVGGEDKGSNDDDDYDDEEEERGREGSQSDEKRS